MVGWYHRLDGHEFEQTLGDNEGQGILAFCSPWGCKELDMTERLNNNKWLYTKPLQRVVLLTPYLHFSNFYAYELTELIEANLGWTYLNS